MKVTLKEEYPAPTDLRAKGGIDDWVVQFNKRQYFELKITGENSDDAKKFVGLNQTMIRSERVISYKSSSDGTIVTLQILPNRKPPCLDGDGGEDRPFYSISCKGQALTQPVTLSLDDQPSVNTTISLIETLTSKKALITKMQVEETFLISLLVYETPPNNKEDSVAWNGFVKSQWTWNYKYTIDANSSQQPLPPNLALVSTGKATEIVAKSQKLVADGDPATEPPGQRISTPSGWKQYYRD